MPVTQLANPLPSFRASPEKIELNTQLLPYESAPKATRLAEARREDSVGDVGEPSPQPMSGTKIRTPPVSARASVADVASVFPFGSPLVIVAPVKQHGVFDAEGTTQSSEAYRAA